MPTTNKRLQLHEILCEILGNRNVYFQPPESIKMKYPAIVYTLNDIEKHTANDEVYLFCREYMITLIDKDPDSLIIEKLAALPNSRYNRHYEADNLNHDVFTLYF